MIFIESAVFTRQVQALLTDDEHAALQWHLALYPKAGAVIQHTGRQRKVRWASGAESEWCTSDLLSRAEPESGPFSADLWGVKDDLSAAEKKVVRKLNDMES